MVGKRTPRVPVSHANDRDLRHNYVSQKLGRNSNIDADDHVAHEIALALTKASPKENSPRVSHSNRASKRKIGNVPSPAKNDDRRVLESQFTCGFIYVFEKIDCSSVGCYHYNL